MFNQSYCASHFNGVRVLCPKKDGCHAVVHFDDVEKLGEVLRHQYNLFLLGLDFVQVFVVGVAGEDVEVEVVGFLFIVQGVVLIQCKK